MTTVLRFTHCDLQPKNDIDAQWERNTPGSIVTLATNGIREKPEAWDAGLHADVEPPDEPVRLRWIPYYAWANRGVGEMCVWVRK